jgi:heat-inducible transcriptional repressor
MITERQKKILNTIIKEYIDSAEPISSQLLEKRYDFGICPASIRIEMQKLTDKGYISQPHTSAGRVPTDKSYRFFVDNLLNKESPLNDRMPKIEEIFKEEEDVFRLANRLTKFLADESSNFVMLNLLEKDLIWKEGWDEILLEPEFEEKNLVSDFLNFLENFEEKVENLKINSGIKVYIGRENPFPKAKNFSIISSRCHLPGNEEALLTIVGPKRMDYDKNISLINSLMKSLEKL